MANVFAVSTLMEGRTRFNIINLFGINRSAEGRGKVSWWGWVCRQTSTQAGVIAEECVECDEGSRMCLSHRRV